MTDDHGSPQRRTLARRVGSIAAALAGMLLLIVWISGGFVATIPPGAVLLPRQAVPAGVPVVEVVSRRVPVVEEAAGTVQPERKTIVSSRVVGTIAAVRVNAGDPVAAGEVLVELDAREAQARLDQAARARHAAQAARDKAAADYERARALVRQGVISRGEFDEAEAAFKGADANLDRAMRAEDEARVALSYTTIRSPVSGRVIDRHADPGDTALPGEPLLSVYDPTALRIEVPIRESLVERVHVGDLVQVRLGTGPDTIDGRVDEIVPQAEAGSRTFLVRIRLPRREGFYTGMFGRALILAGERARILVPRAAVERVGQLDFVFVVGADGEVVRRLVTLGPESGDDGIEVLSGLRAGERVVGDWSRVSATALAGRPR